MRSRLPPNGGGSGYTIPTVDFDYAGRAGRGEGHGACRLWDADETASSRQSSWTSRAPATPSRRTSSIRDGTIFDPILPVATAATATATLTVQTVVLDTFGADYTSTPTVTITDPTGHGQRRSRHGHHQRSAASPGSPTSSRGSGYLTAGGIKKFQDGLPMLCDPSVAGQLRCCREQPGPVPPAGGARHHDLHGSPTGSTWMQTTT